MMYRTVICVLLFGVVGVGLGCGLFAPDEEADALSEHKAGVVSVAASERTAVPAEPGWTASGGSAPQAIIGDSSVYGHTTLEERVLRADVIVRTRLRSKAVSSRWYYFKTFARNLYVPYVDFTFDVLETVKGSAGSTVVVELEASKPFDWRTRGGIIFEAAEAEQRARDWIRDEYDSRWEYRDAILFLMDVTNAQAYYKSGRSSTVQYAFVGHQYGGEASALNGKDGFSIASPMNKAWFPATRTSSGAQMFYLESPDEAESPSTASLSSLKSSIATIEAEVEDSVSGYAECLVEKSRDEREIRPAGFLYANTVELESGLSSDTVVVDRGVIVTQQYWYYHLYGDDAALFETGVFDADSDPTNGFRSDIEQVRPLPAGSYVVEEARQLETMKPCGYIEAGRGRWTFNAIASVGTLHELFFDPVNQGGAVKADDTNGVLESRAFTDASGGSATISSISYEASTVKVGVTPDGALAGQVLEFIELDGTVSLSLEVGGATVVPSAGSGQAGTLSWSVSSQPWEDGDMLMVRIRGASP